MFIQKIGGDKYKTDLENLIARSEFQRRLVEEDSERLNKKFNEINKRFEDFEKMAQKLMDSIESGRVKVLSDALAEFISAIKKEKTK